MKIKLYKRWIKFVVMNFPRHLLLKQPNGKYLLAYRIWNYSRLYPNSTNSIVNFVDEFLKLNDINRKKKR